MKSLFSMLVNLVQAVHRGLPRGSDHAPRFHNPGYETARPVLAELCNADSKRHSKSFPRTATEHSTSHSVDVEVQADAGTVDSASAQFERPAELSGYEE